MYVQTVLSFLLLDIHFSVEKEQVLLTSVPAPIYIWVWRYKSGFDVRCDPPLLSPLLKVVRAGCFVVVNEKKEKEWRKMCVDDASNNSSERFCTSHTRCM